MIDGFVKIASSVFVTPFHSFLTPPSLLLHSFFALPLLLHSTKKSGHYLEMTPTMSKKEFICDQIHELMLLSSSSCIKITVVVELLLSFALLLLFVWLKLFKWNFPNSNDGMNANVEISGTIPRHHVLRQTGSRKWEESGNGNH